MPPRLLAAILLAQTPSPSPSPDGKVQIGGIDTVIESVQGILKGVLSVLPNIALALVVLAIFGLAARLVRKRVEPRLTRMKTPSFGKVAASLIYVGIILAGILIAVPIAIPSVKVSAVLGGLGLLGVAAGFAFQDILSNLLAGILLILRQPFRSGDQIEVNSYRGTVVTITIRETQIKTFDGRLIYIPNADVYTNAIEVQTHYDVVRTSLEVGVDYDADLALARSTALEVLAGIEDIAGDPAPQAYYTEFGASSITLDLRYWTSSQQAEVRRVQDQVVERVKAAFDAKDIGIPFDIVTLDTSPAFEALMERRGRDAGNGSGA